MKPGIYSISNIFGAVMVVVVVSLALGVAFTDMLEDRLYGNKRIFFIVMLLGYAIYRGFRLYQSYQQTRNER